MDAFTDTDSLESAFPSPKEPAPTPSPRFQRWQYLLEVAPELRKMQKSGPNEVPPPYPLADNLFLALCACLADPRRREVLRALMFDLLMDDVVDLLVDRSPEEGT